MRPSQTNARIIVVGGHTRSIGKTQLVCDIVAALPEANWIAGKITQYGHGVCARNGHDCDCAPDEHVCAIDWEHDANSGTDSSRFLAAGAKRSFWLRTKQGFLAEGMPLLRSALDEIIQTRQRVAQPPIDPASSTALVNVILESNTLLQFLKPDLFLMVLHPAKSDFKDSAKLQLNQASAFVLREPIQAHVNGQKTVPSWQGIPLPLLDGKPQFLQREGEPIPTSLLEIVRNCVCNEAPTPSIKL
jgi:molybdopterin-guanine dinucleotide biosynthesis protein